MTKKVKTPEADLNEGDATPAAASLHPGAAPSDGGSFDPSRSQMYAAILAAAGGVEKGDLSKFLDSIAQIGHEADSIDGGAAERNKSTLNMKPSAAVREDLATIFAGEELSEEFIDKAAVIFEAAVETKTMIAAAQIEEEFEAKLETAYQELNEQITNQIDEYLNYVVESWVQDNQLAVDESLKADITESFIEGMKKLFQEHYIDVPEDRVDVVEELVSKVEELQAQLDDAINENMKNKKDVDDAQKSTLIATASEGLTMTQADKFKSLCESVDYTGDDEVFTTQLKLVKDNYFKASKPKNSTQIISEEIAVDEGSEMIPAERKLTGPMSAYTDALSRTVKR